MTSRRSLRTWAERASRQSQFDPGHVGGRVDSAQPIRRRGGTLRRVSVGTAGVAPVTYMLTDTSGGTTGEFWEFVPEPTLPGTNGHFLVTFASTETTVAVSYGVPPGDAIALDMAAAGPYSAGVPYATEAIVDAAADMWFECFSYPATSVQWVPA